MQKTIGILAHADAGKTTFSEQLLYHTGAIRSLGRVDHKDTFLDSNALERERGITIFAQQAVFTHNENTYYLLDTPGHVDFAAEMERCAAALDCAVLLISAAEGIQSHTYTLWNLLQKKNIPVLIFINKTDRTGADVDKVMRDICADFSPYAICMDGQLQPDISCDLQEELAGMDEELLEFYLQHGYEKQTFIDSMRDMLRKRKLFPVLSGSALNGKGIDAFLNVLSSLVTWEPPSGELQAYIYKVAHEKGTRVCYLKIMQGILGVKEIVSAMNKQGNTIQEKVNEMRLYSGEKYVSVSSAEAGGLCAVTGLSAVCGTYIGIKETQDYLCVPLFTVRVLFDEKKWYSKTVVEKLRILEDEDPLLSVRFEERLGEIHLDIMGAMQTEVLTRIICERFHMDVSFGQPSVLYKETISAPVIGSGHFEPLRHYAEVRFRLSPAERGSGIQFASSCSTDVLAPQYQNLICTHIFEKQHKGVLTGADITDITITLLTGRAHLKHTEGGDFREAVYRAIRQGLCKAESVLLEPFYHMHINIPADEMGRILADIQKMSGTFQSPEIDGDRAVIRAYVPVAECMDYAADFVRQTGGKGRIQFHFAGYDLCHNTDEVLENTAYDKERDIENTPDSVFCAHGAGYPVKWYEADERMHCQI